MSKTDLQSLPSAYDHQAAQSKWYPFWEKQGYFHADPAPVLAGEKKPFSVVIPPPNVTGALHLGHALNNTLQDILCRRKRMEGYEVLWMPGTDHAGIATQAVVERRLLHEEGKSRHDLGREGLVERIWQWKEQYEDRITGQLKQLGCSCDWERQQFTLNDQCARAVRETFFKLFKDRKIYMGQRLVNWDTFLQTAVSDDEVFHEEVKGHFWSFHYPVVDPKPGEPTRVTIATTRPETMLGDTAVAVHPEPAKQLNKVEKELREKLATAPEKEKAQIEAQIEALMDRRKTHLPMLEKLRDMATRGVKLELPLTDRSIPLITDEWAKPELGSGCVKITPAHDANDYAVMQRVLERALRWVRENKVSDFTQMKDRTIDALNIMNADGTLNDNVPQKYRGLSMKDARNMVLKDLEACGCHNPETDVEDRLIDLAHSDRSKTPIEPYLADQWFVQMEDIQEPGDGLAQTAIDAVQDGRVRIVPARYAKSYVDWLSEKRDWPIGRQLWWGHRIPVWNPTEERLYRGDVDPELYENTSAWFDEERLHPGGHYNAPTIGKDYSENISYNDFYHCVRVEDDKQVIEALERDGYVHDEGVLDTWFSSALWPFSTMGWPEKTDLLKAFYPTSVLLTSRDIITLWVARMVLMGLYNDPLGAGDPKKAIPFPEVYIHPKILDGFGETMSKSKGNGVDPLDVIDQFGADALRFGIAYLTTETQDVRLPVEFVCPGCGATIKQTKKNRVLPRIECPECQKPFRTQWAEKEEDLALPRGPVTSERFELGRNFCNKLWNASRFALANLEGYSGKQGASATGELKLEDRWLLSRLSTVTEEVSTALDEYRFADAARALYDFAWNEFCSFYVEMTKARFAEEGPDKQVAQGVLAHGLDTLLRLLHPITPFLTEEVWQLLGEVAPVRPSFSENGPAAVEAAESVCVAEWPGANDSDRSKQIEEQFAKFQAVLGAVREVRQAQSIPNKEPVEFVVHCNEATAKLLEPMQPYFTKMARATATELGPDVVTPEIAASKPIGGFDSKIDVHVNVAAFIDVEAEQARLSKEQAKLAKFVGSLKGKLSNDKFVANAPAEVVDAERAKLAEAESQLASVEGAMEKLAAK